MGESFTKDIILILYMYRVDKKRKIPDVLYELVALIWKLKKQNCMPLSLSNVHVNCISSIPMALYHDKVVVIPGKQRYVFYFNWDTHSSHQEYIKNKKKKHDFLKCQKSH